MATLKKACRVYKTKLKHCPLCKSKKGFTLNYVIGGNGSITMDFKGNTLDAERSQFDTLDTFAECLNCRKYIETERLKTD